MSPVIHPGLSEAEVAEFQEIFNLVDVDHGGSISKDELRQLMHTLGLKPSQEEIDAMVSEIDQDGNGEIDFDEFVTVMSRKAQPSYTPEQVKAAFRVFEKGTPSGFVRTTDVEKALLTYGADRVTRDEARELLKQVDPENTGLINYVEYINIMTGG